MVITTTPARTESDNESICVELDSTSWFVDYVQYKKSDNVRESDLYNPFPMDQILYKAESLNKVNGIQNGFHWKDEMLSKNTNIGLRNFIFPQKDLFGFCDNFKSTTFLLDIDPDLQGACVQIITDPAEAASTVLNPNTYIQTYLKGSSPESQTKRVQKGDVYILNGQTGEMTGPDSAYAFAAPVYSETDCTISNYAQEVFFRVYYREEKAKYVIDKITANFIIVDSQKLGDAPCAASEYQIGQKFGIDYVISRESVSAADQSLAEIAETKQLQRSGNPGYELNHPVLVGEGLDTNDSKQVNVLGFYLRSANNLGECI